MATLSSLWGKRPAKPVTPAGASAPPAIDMDGVAAAKATDAAGAALPLPSVANAIVNLALPGEAGKAVDAVPTTDAVSYVLGDLGDGVGWVGCGRVWAGARATPFLTPAPLPLTP